MTTGWSRILTLVIGWFLWQVMTPLDAILVAQEKDPVFTSGDDQRPDQAEIEKSLSDLLESLPELHTDSHDNSRQTPNSASEPNPESSTHSTLKQQPITDIVAVLEAKIQNFETKRKLSPEEKTALSRLRIELKIAKTIRQQLRRAKPSKANRSDKDSFVIAQLEVLPQANVLDVRFQSTEGEMESVHMLWEYVCQTPQQGFRDFRIISRHAPDDDSKIRLAQVRRDYDDAKKQQEQYLQYVAQQRAALTRIAAARRC